MSLVLEFAHKTGSETIAQLVERIAQTPEYLKINNDTDLSFGNDELLMFRIENVMRLSLIPVSPEMIGALIEEFFELAHLGALNATQLYRLYVGKNILNQFRQDHGYKEGSYIKVWNGEEDNVVMKRAWDQNPDMTPTQLYDALKSAYPV
jgi:hypothetical protein